MNIIEIIMSAGKSAVNVSLYTLLPIMVVMLAIMRFLEAKGVLEKIVKVFGPLLKPFGLGGMSLFAIIQMNFVSFAAPIATLTMMDRQGESDRRMAATLAMSFAMGQANVFYPFIPQGLHWLPAIGISILGGLVAGAATWHIFGRRLSSENFRTASTKNRVTHKKQGLLAIINLAGADAIRLSAGAIPMLIISLAAVNMLEAVGFVHLLEHLLSPLLTLAGISPVFILATLVKTMAGGTAYFGVASDLIAQGKFTVNELNASAGLLVQTLDLPGIGIFLAVSSRFVRLFRYVLPGALVGIAVRTCLHILIYS